jgi:hypothetical protein
MSFIGTVAENGSVVLPPDAKLPPGSQVRVEPLPAQQHHESVWDVLKRFEGTAKGMPSDLAENHDHYAHGKPKQP